MNVKVENVEKNVVQLEIEVDAAKFEEGMKQSFIKNAKKFNVPGFRRGKAPRSVVERYYGEQVLYEDAINIVCADAYDEAVEENDLHPVERPELDIKQIGSGQNLIFTAKVTVKPEVTLGEYKGLEIKKTVANVTDEDVDNEIKKAAEKNARLVSVEDRPVQKDDITTIDFEGFVDGVAFEGGKGTDYSLTIGSGQFIPGFEDQLIGAKIGEEAEVKVTFPEEYHSEELSGKPATFKVTVKEIKVKDIPTIDDEFAKDVSEFDTLEAYKEDLKNKMVHEAEHQAEHKNEDSVIAKAVENASVEIPEVMVSKRIDDLVRDFEMRIQYQGLDLNKYLEIMGMDYNTFRGQFGKRAEDEVKTQLILEKISQVENIEVTDEDVDNEIKTMAENYKQDAEEFKKHLSEDDIEYIKESNKMKKTIDFLVENTKFVE